MIGYIDIKRLLRMFNFSGKYTQCTNKSPTEIDFGVFWKALDESNFVHLAPSSLENKWKDVVDKIQTFTQNHHHGIIKS